MLAPLCPFCHPPLSPQTAGNLEPSCPFLGPCTLVCPSLPYSLGPLLPQARAAVRIPTAPTATTSQPLNPTVNRLVRFLLGCGHSLHTEPHLSLSHYRVKRLRASGKRKEDVSRCWAPSPGLAALLIVRVLLAIPSLSFLQIGAVGVLGAPRGPAEQGRKSQGQCAPSSLLVSGGVMKGRVGTLGRTPRRWAPSPRLMLERSWGRGWGH